MYFLSAVVIFFDTPLDTTAKKTGRPHRPQNQKVKFLPNTCKQCIPHTHIRHDKQVHLRTSKHSYYTLL